MVLIFKKTGKMIFRWIFWMMPLELARRIIMIIPRLSVAAPAGIVCRRSDYLGEFTIHVDTTYGIERKMFTGVYENDAIKIIEKLVNEGDVCFDIGANVGPIAFALAQKVTPKGKVYAFEPGPPTFERLVQNIAVNPVYSSAIIAENLGVSEQNGELLWSEGTGYDGRGNGSLRVGGNISAKVVSLDDYCMSSGIDEIDFIKIDVEGMELEVIKGAKTILEKYRPILYFETLPNIEETRGFPVFTEIANILRNLNYDFYSTSITGELTRQNKVGVSVMTLAIPHRN